MICAHNHVAGGEIAENAIRIWESEKKLLNVDESESEPTSTTDNKNLVQESSHNIDFSVEVKIKPLNLSP